MSFRVTAKGTKSEVLKKIANEQIPETMPMPQKMQFARVRRFVVSELENAPEGSYYVEMYGHADERNCASQVAIYQHVEQQPTITQDTMHKDNPEVPTITQDTMHKDNPEVPTIPPDTMHNDNPETVKSEAAS